MFGREGGVALFMIRQEKVELRGGLIFLPNYPEKSFSREHESIMMRFVTPAATTDSVVRGTTQYVNSNKSRTPLMYLQQFHIRFFMANFPYLPNFGSLEHPYGLEEAPVVH